MCSCCSGRVSIESNDSFDSLSFSHSCCVVVIRYMFTTSKNPHNLTFLHDLTHKNSHTRFLNTHTHFPNTHTNSLKTHKPLTHKYFPYTLTLDLHSSRIPPHHQISRTLKTPLTLMNGDMLIRSMSRWETVLFRKYSAYNCEISSSLTLKQDTNVSA